FGLGQQPADPALWERAHRVHAFAPPGKSELRPGGTTAVCQPAATPCAPIRAARGARAAAQGTGGMAPSGTQRPRPQVDGDWRVSQLGRRGPYDGPPSRTERRSFGHLPGLVQGSVLASMVCALA